MLKLFRYHLLIIVLITIAVIKCTYEPLPEPEVPEFNTKINIPLLEVDYKFTELVDPENNILSNVDSDYIYFRFQGDIDTTTLTRDIFVLPVNMSFEITQSFEEIDQSYFNLNISHTERFRLSEVLNEHLPSDYNIVVDSIPRMTMFDSRQGFRVFDKYGIPFFKRVDYVTIGDGDLFVTIDNRLGLDISPVIIQIVDTRGNVIYNASHDIIESGTTIEDGEYGNLAGVSIADSIYFIIAAEIPGTDGQPHTIPAGTDPYASLSVSLNVREVESVTGIPKPISFDIRRKLPKSKNTVINAVLAMTQTNPQDTNFLKITYNNNTDLNLLNKVTLLNFYDEDGVVALENTISGGTQIISKKRLDGDTLRNPDGVSVVDSIFIKAEFDFLPNAEDTLVTIRIGKGAGGLGINLYISNMLLSEITGFFNLYFDIPPMTIRNIPEGLDFVKFKYAYLLITIYNQIQTSTYLNLDLNGYKNGNVAKTITVEDTITKATDAIPVSESIIKVNVAPLFNLLPDSIEVTGVAYIPSNDTSRLQVGKSFWGSYEVNVPFVMKTKPVTFIPVKSTVLEPVDEDTRQRIKTGLVSAEVMYNVENGCPLAGTLQLLFSNFDYFPLDSSEENLDSGYVWINDSLFADTDTGLVYISIDTLFGVRLPKAEIDQVDGSVKNPGFISESSVLDTVKLFRIIEDKVHYIRPRIFLDSTSTYVRVSDRNMVKISSLLSITISSEGLLK
ncbi:MAG: hypothetical protein H0Z29_05225 [Candidatus Marinimicrobia bacterium]|nr:hypothetical protein [Candidatus Neomarinimicrobiota bacterium]